MHKILFLSLLLTSGAALAGAPSVTPSLLTAPLKDVPTALAAAVRQKPWSPADGGPFVGGQGALEIGYVLKPRLVMLLETETQQSGQSGPGELFGFESAASLRLTWLSAGPVSLSSGLRGALRGALVATSSTVGLQHLVSYQVLTTDWLSIGFEGEALTDTSGASPALDVAGRSACSLQFGSAVLQAEIEAAGEVLGVLATRTLTPELTAEVAVGFPF